MSLAGLSLETATRRGGVVFGDEVVAVLMRAVTVARLVRRVVVRVGVEGRIEVVIFVVVNFSLLRWLCYMGISGS